MFSSPPIYSKPNAPKQPRRAAYAVPEVCGPTKGKFCNIAGSPVNTRSGMLRKSVAKMKANRVSALEADCDRSLLGLGAARVLARRVTVQGSRERSHHPGRRRPGARHRQDFFVGEFGSVQIG